MLKRQEERRGTSSVKTTPNIKENHRTQELDARKKNTNFLHHLLTSFIEKAKDPTSSDEKKEDQELYNEPFRQEQ